MYFSQNKKPSERRANEEYRRRMVDARPLPADESLPACALPPTEPEEPGSCQESRPLAMVYSPKQAFEALYEPTEALARGTLFAALDLPFEGRSVTKR